MSILTRWEPFGGMQQEVSRFRRDFDRMFGRLAVPTLTWSGQAASFPALNIWEDEDSVYAEAELPGQTLQDLEITITGDHRLTIKGERKQQLPEKAEWHRQERGFGGFERVIDLPVSMDSSKVEAHFENGVLTIRMCKSPQAKPRKITVKSE
jgi:HSP20 family protein